MESLHRDASIRADVLYFVVLSVEVSIRLSGKKETCYAYCDGSGFCDGSRSAFFWTLAWKCMAEGERGRWIGSIACA